MVSDFEEIFMNLKPHSRRVLNNMGASLTIHQKDYQPIMFYLNLFKKFGFTFDHIYGFEKEFTDPELLYDKLISQDLLSSYHWINAPVNMEKGYRLNPFDTILREYTKDGFVIVKLDVDTHAVEIPLTYQLRDDKSLKNLVDVFLFEYHVIMADMVYWWTTSM